MSNKLNITELEMSIENKIREIQFSYGNCISLLSQNVDSYIKREVEEKIPYFFNNMMTGILPLVEYILQYINVVTGNEYEVRNISFNQQTIKNLSNQFYLRFSDEKFEIKANLKSLLKHTQYIIDYCNTIKHRKLIFFKNNFYKLGNTHVINFIKIESFIKDKRQHEEKDLYSYSRYVGKKLLPNIIRLYHQIKEISL